jgi:YfiH family protein
VSLSLRSELLTGLGFRHGFSLRAAGVSRAPYHSLNLGRTVGDDPLRVTQNLQLFANDVGYAAEHLYEVTQVHGARVAHVDPTVAPEAFRTREADALVSGGTLRSGADLRSRAEAPRASTGARASVAYPVGIKVADCVAVLLADPETGAVAAAHAGWRGVVADVVGATVRELGERHGAPSPRLVAAVFPCIGVSAFEVGDEVAAQLEAAAGSASVVSRGADKPHVDLALATRLLLTRAGLLDARVETVIGCTFSEPSRFFSYRRDQGVTGRHLAAIVPRC